MEIAPQLTHCGILTGVGRPHRSHKRNGRATSAPSFSLYTGASENQPRSSRIENRGSRIEDRATIFKWVLMVVEYKSLQMRSSTHDSRSSILVAWLRATGPTARLRAHCSRSINPTTNFHRYNCFKFKSWHPHNHPQN